MAELSEEDEAALANFCQNIDLPDITFSAWRASHRDLHLYISVSISPLEAERGGTRSVHFVRTIVSEPGNTGKNLVKTKESVAYSISWPAGIRHRAEIILAGMGDRRGIHRGDLKVTLIIS